MKWMRRINPPCKKCPYTLGLVTYFKSPCPECKQNNYSTYDTLISQIIGKNIAPGSRKSLSKLWDEYLKRR